MTGDGVTGLGVTGDGVTGLGVGTEEMQITRLALYGTSQSDFPSKEEPTKAVDAFAKPAGHALYPVITPVVVSRATTRSASNGTSQSDFPSKEEP